MRYLIFVSDVRALEVPLAEQLPVGWCSLSGSRKDRLEEARAEHPDLIKSYHRLELVELGASDARPLDKFVTQGMTPREAFLALLKKRGSLRLIYTRAPSSTPREWIEFKAPQETPDVHAV